ncbi:MAG: hypothetical protein ACLR3C_12040 [Eggerthella lenta]
MKQALSRQERECAAGAPSFAYIAARIAAEPSVFDAPAWSVLKSARLAADLARAQMRVVPRAVLPAALIIAAAAAGAACFAVSAGATGAAPWWFSTLLLLGVAITVTAALSTDAADALALAMPLGRRRFARCLTTVLGVDALAGLALRRRSPGGARRLASAPWCCRWRRWPPSRASRLSRVHRLAMAAGVAGAAAAAWRRRSGARGRRRDGGGAGRVAEYDRPRSWPRAAPCWRRRLPRRDGRRSPAWSRHDARWARDVF